MRTGPAAGEAAPADAVAGFGVRDVDIATRLKRSVARDGRAISGVKAAQFSLRAAPAPARAARAL
jgi:hypothetical protein